MRRLHHKRVLRQKMGVLTSPLTRGYLLTSNSGVYHLSDGNLFRVFSHKVYGIALAEEHAFLSVHLGEFSAVIRCNRAALLGRSCILDLRVLYTLRVQDPSDRIHGLSWEKGGLWVANTSRNTLIKIDPDSGLILREIPVMTDRAGTPLFYNVNHINSVTALSSYVLFVASRAGCQSLLGVLEGDRVTVYGYGNIGVHDLYPTRDGFLFCDTFGQAGEEGRISGGCVYSQKGILNASWFRERSLTVRGLAGDPEGEWLTGCSLRGERSERFKGNGTLLVWEAEQIRAEITLPGIAQIYQIVQENGVVLTGAPLRKAEEMRQQFESALGPPLWDEGLRQPHFWVQRKWCRYRQGY